MLSNQQLGRCMFSLRWEIVDVSLPCDRLRVVIELDRMFIFPLYFPAYCFFHSFPEIQEILQDTYFPSQFCWRVCWWIYTAQKNGERSSVVLPTLLDYLCLRLFHTYPEARLVITASFFNGLILAFTLFTRYLLFHLHQVLLLKSNVS